MKAAEPTILVIIGISSDLAHRKLLPAIYKIGKAGLLPNDFRILGVSRRRLSKADVLATGKAREVGKMLELCQVDPDNPSDYYKLAARLRAIEKDMDAKPQHLFYLSVPPQITQKIVELLGTTGLLSSPRAKLLLEKPFGTDLNSAEALVKHLSANCREEQIYRIDHYLAKEMAQNLIVLRAGNPLISGTWNRDFIESIEIYAAETIGVEGRTASYEQTGALRDMVQSHLLQLAALVLMDLPSNALERDIASKRLKALKALAAPRNIASQVTRGQYIGYREESGNPLSQVETFVSLGLTSKDRRWRGVPITLTAGKALDSRTTEIRINYRPKNTSHTNKFVLRIQPNEGMTLHFWVKQPGYGYEMQPLPLVLAYDHHFSELPDAYERVFVDAMRSDRTLFTTSQEVLASWRLLQPVLDFWSKSTGEDLILYQPGQKPGL